MLLERGQSNPCQLRDRKPSIYRWLETGVQTGSRALSSMANPSPFVPQLLTARHWSSLILSIPIGNLARLSPAVCNSANMIKIGKCSVLSLNYLRIGGWLGWLRHAFRRSLVARHLSVINIWLSEKSIYWFVIYYCEVEWQQV